jgi:ubiquinol-cytochrome c reductase cytochrome c subunit
VKAIAARRHHRFVPMVLLALALLLTGGLYAAFAPTAASATVGDESDIEAGRALFLANCATCHGPDGGGREGFPSLVGVGAAAVDFQVSTGRMPAQMNGPQIAEKPVVFTDEQIAQMAAYVASLGAGPPIPTDDEVDPARGDAANGMSLFRTNCAMCHGAVGAGGALSEGKYAPSLTGSTPREIWEAMVTGPQSMPVFNNVNLTPEEKRDIIAFVELQEAGSPGGTALGSVGPVAEALWVWVVGLGLLIACAVWIGAKSS